MRLLIVEDDKELAQAVKVSLEKQEFTVDLCHDGEDGLFYMKENVYDLIILDRLLPGMDGVSLLREARAAHINTPVIFLTALGQLSDKITGLDCGADDYMVKPFAFEELMARIRCLLRRPKAWEESSLLRVGDITFDPQTNLLSRGEKNCTLSKREATLLEFFLKNPGQILPRPLLLNRVWGLDSDVEDGNLDNYIHFLRRRLSAVHSTLALKTIRGVGYQLTE